MLCSDMYLISFIKSDSSSTRITMVVISPQFYLGGENQFNSKSMETSEFASRIATVWGNGWSCNPKSSKSFLHGLLLFQAMGEVAYPRAVRDISFLMNWARGEVAIQQQLEKLKSLHELLLFWGNGFKLHFQEHWLPYCHSNDEYFAYKAKMRVVKPKQTNPFCYLKWWGAFLQTTKP